MRSNLADHSSQLAKNLIDIETSLAACSFQSVSLDFLLTKYHEQIYRGLKVHSSLRILAHWMYFILKGIFINKPLASSRSLLLSKISEKPQCNALIDPLKERFGREALLFTPQHEKNEISAYNFFKRISWSNLNSALQFIRRNASKLESIYIEKGIKLSKLDFRFFLFTQLIAVSNWQHFFSSYTFKKIIVDFDRDNTNAAMLAVAKIHNIPSVTLVHGVINPPFGYFPILADEIWVWGNYQKELLESFGLEAEKIRIVGNPIAKRMTLERRVNNKVTFGIALNPMPRSINESFLEAIFYHRELVSQFDWIIKLHPSMKKEDFLLNYENEFVSLKSFDELDNHSFFESIDALILGNSGIGYEALINDVPLIIGRTSKDSFGHDHIMIEKGKCPNIFNKSEYKELLESILNDSTVLDSLINKEREFLDQEYYYAIGRAATENIINTIENHSYA